MATRTSGSKNKSKKAQFALIFFTLFWACTAKTQKTVFNNKPTVTDGQLIVWDSINTTFTPNPAIFIWLPPNYKKYNKYPVVYMQDGQMLFDSTLTWNKQSWEVDRILGFAIRTKQLKPCIVVGIANGGIYRRSAYFPQKPFENLPKATQDSLLYEAKTANKQALFHGKINSDAYLKYLVNDLKPLIDREFATLPNQLNTFIAGSSMGGLISWYAVSQFPEIFAGAACLSTHWPGAHNLENNPIPNQFIQFLTNNCKPFEGKKMYFDCGNVGLDSLYPKIQNKMDSVYKTCLNDKMELKSERFLNDDHTETAWQNMLLIALQFLLNP